jgi:hypothetical protein
VTRHGGLVTVDLDATIVIAHSEKEQAADGSTHEFLTWLTARGRRLASGECRAAAGRALSCPYHAGRFHLACPLSGDAWRAGIP